MSRLVTYECDRCFVTSHGRGSLGDSIPEDWLNIGSNVHLLNKRDHRVVYLCRSCVHDLARFMVGLEVSTKDE